AGRLYNSIAGLNGVRYFPETELFLKPENTVALKSGEIRQLEFVGGITAAILQERKQQLRIALPVKEGGLRNALLFKTEITASGFRVGALGSNPNFQLPIDAGIHYQGIIEGDSTSLVAVSVTNEGLAGMVATKEGQLELISDPHEKKRCLVLESRLADNSSGYDCLPLEVPAQLRVSVPNGTTSTDCKSVNVYFECDYRLYTDKGSNNQAVSAYVLSFFNQVSALYRNEGIDLRISAINIWTTPDPYASLSSAAEVLPIFRTTAGSSFNGNLAHLLTTRNIGGGMSYLDVLCLRSYAHGVSYIHSSNNGNPSYSWTVEVVAHELGHNIGSHHTQWCGWQLQNGSTGALDNCYSTEGGCPTGATPMNGGTIMSYCHLTSHGINFSNGFGVLPGELLRSKVANAGCVMGSAEPPTGLSSTSVTAATAELSWTAPLSGADYTVQYKPVSAVDWNTGPTTGNLSMIVSNLIPSTEYQWRVRTECSGFSAESRFTTATGIGCTPPSGLVSNTGRNGEANITWNKSAGKQGYSIRYRLTGSTDWNILDGIADNRCTLSGLSPVSDYEFQVRSACSEFSASSLFTTPPIGCAAPSGLNANSITRNGVTFNWNLTPGATGYTIRYRRVGAEQWTQLGPRNSTHLGLTGLSPGTAYEWKVRANCSGYSAVQTFSTVEASPMPSGELTNEVFQVFPNPAGSKFEIRFELSMGATAVRQLTLSDMVGKVLIQRWVGESESKLEVEISELPDGIYIVQVTDESGKNFKKRLIKR
ncbi:MAG: hypothetical protein RL021_1023, partial [Bacteroidota bacterium]